MKSIEKTPFSQTSSFGQKNQASNLIRKLASYKNKINYYKTLNQNLEDLISVELFDFIHEKVLLKKEFYRRFQYLANLSNDKSFLETQDNLFKIINKILTLATTKEIEQLQKEFNGAFINRFKTKEDKEWLTIPELYNVLQDKKNYYKLGEMNPCYAEEISNFTSTSAIIQQYESAEILINKIRFGISIQDIRKQNTFNVKFCIPIEDKKRHNKLNQLSQQYDKNYYKFIEKIKHTPKKLHQRFFEEFFLFCVERREWPQYEFFFKIHRNNPEYITRATIDGVKNVCSVVIDDLIEDLQNKQDLESQDLSAKKQEQQNKQKIKIFISQENGIYKNETIKKPNYPISGRRSKIIRHLKDGKKEGRLLVETLGINYQILSKDITEINSIFKKKLRLKQNLIISVETGGYRLNNEYYDIKFVD